MSPKLFLKTSPYPTGPRFPFVASSKLSLKKPLGGWFHLCRLKVELSLGEGWTFCEWGAIPQFCRIVVSNWLALKSSYVHGWKKKSFKYILLQLIHMMSSNWLDPRRFFDYALSRLLRLWTLELFWHAIKNVVLKIIFRYSFLWFRQHLHVLYSFFCIRVSFCPKDCWRVGKSLGDDLWSLFYCYTKHI